MYLSAFFQKTLFLVPNVGMLMQDTVILKNEEKLNQTLAGISQQQNISTKALLQSIFTWLVWSTVSSTV